jgi:nucleotide sugar dehydrogenase
LTQVLRSAASDGALHGTTDIGTLRHADHIVCCFNIDLHRAADQTEQLEMDTAAAAEILRGVGRHLAPHALVVLESTVPLGMCETLLYPALCEGVRDQGRDPVAHPPRFAFCYERVMPGPGYLDSVNNFWRSYAGIDERSADHAERFLSTYVNTKQYPLWRHKSLRAAEMAKLMENAYRATNIAFIEEWAILAERAGVDLFDVVNSIRVRKGTHDNMMFPGLGVGGYCVTKDALLAAYGAAEILGIDAELPFSRRAILTNERMPLRAVEMLRAGLGGALAGKSVALLGVTYRPGVADNRSSPAEIVARALAAEGAFATAFDPLAVEWREMPEVPLLSDLEEALRAKDGVIVCLPDRSYQKELAGLLIECMRPGSVLVDAWNLVAEDVALPLAAKGVRVCVYGRGDIGVAPAV